MRRWYSFVNRAIKLEGIVFTVSLITFSISYHSIDLQTTISD